MVLAQEEAAPGPAANPSSEAPKGGATSSIWGGVRGHKIIRRAAAYLSREDVGFVLAARRACFAALLALAAGAPAHAQESTGGKDGTGARGRYLAPASQVVAIRAGRLFDASSGTLVANQTILVRGDRIAEVGANVSIPRGARVIDLGSATVLPGMIDAHVHVNTGGNEGGSLPGAFIHRGTDGPPAAASTVADRTRATVSAP
jgi:hypothetical protein